MPATAAPGGSYGRYPLASLPAEGWTDVKYRELVRVLRAHGWVWAETDRGDGSHRVFQHSVKSGIIVLPFHGSNRDVPRKILKVILKQAGLL